MALIALCLLRLQDIIIIKGLSLSRFNLSCDVSLHKWPETLLIDIERFKNEFLKRSCLTYLAWSSVLLIIIQLFCYVLLNSIAVWRWCRIMGASVWLLYWNKILLARKFLLTQRHLSGDPLSFRASLTNRASIDILYNGSYALLAQALSQLSSLIDNHFLACLGFVNEWLW